MDSKKYFVALLAAYLNNITPPTSHDVNWDEIEYLANIHNVQAMIFMAIDKLNKKPIIYNNLRQAFIISVKNSTIQEAYVNQVTAALTEGNVRHTVFKGFVLREYYPDKEARTFGDIDILIDESDRKISDEIIKAAGFSLDEEHYNRDVWTYYKGIVTLEVHTHLIYHKLFNDFDYIKYFDEKSKNQYVIAGYTCELKKEDHLIYVLVHLAKHFYHSGVGIRMYMDVAVFVKRFSNELDFSYIKNELTYLHLWEFTNTVFYFCKKYFGLELDCYDLDISQELDVFNYIINHGVFGFDGKDALAVKYHKDSKNNFIVLKERLFPKYETMIQCNKWFSNGKKYQLPIAWVVRLILQISKKEQRELIGKKLKAAIGCESDIKEHDDILKTVGLK